MLAAPGETRIRALRLRAPTEARSSAIRALQGLDWDLVRPEEVLILRRIRAQGPVEGLGRLALEEARHLAAQAVSGWFAAADNAAAVRFASREDLLACLLRDLSQGRQRWFWRSWQALFGLSPGRAAVRLLAEAPLSWPGVIRRLASNGAVLDLWRTLHRDDAGELLGLIERATGWVLSGDSHALAGEDIAAEVMLGAQPASTQVGSIFTVGRAEPHAADWLKPLRSLLTVDGEDSPRTRLAALTWLWLNAPQRLTNANAAAQIDCLTQSLSDAHAIPTAGMHPSAQMNRAAADDSSPQAGGMSTGEAGRIAVAATTGARPDMSLDLGTASHAALEREHLSMPVGSPILDTDQPGGETPKAPSSLAKAMTHMTREHPRVDQPAPSALGPAAEVRLVTLQGGWFLLLNALQLPALQALVHDAPPAPCPAAGWYWLYRLGRALGGVADSPLQRFLASMAGLEPEEDLEALPPLPGEAELARLTRQRYGEAVCNPALFPRPALVLATPSHLDVHYRMADLRLDVRRVALDINPGWLPWLGRVVNFHYGQPAELAGLQA